MKPRLLPLGVLVFALALAGCSLGLRAGDAWTATWATAPQLCEPHNLPPAPGLDGATLRQVVRVSIGGSRLRLALSNEYGDGPLVIDGATVAAGAGMDRIQPGTVRPLTFSGAAGTTLAAGATVLCDPLAFELAPRSDLVISLLIRTAPKAVTSHPGSRTTSYLQTGDHLGAEAMPAAVRTDHWYFINVAEVLAPAGTPVLAIIGDSITDGRGSTTNGNDRWPDQLLRRLHADPATAHVALANYGIGGNRVLRDGLGPSALSRFERDVLNTRGVRWVIVYEGINDLGTAAGARAKGEPAATAADLIAAFSRMIDLAHARGLRIYGATIMPYEGAAYFSAEGEADRQAVNHWIRTSGRFDAVIDFDALMRDPEHPARLAAKAGAPDGLHPNADGYRVMAESIDLKLFAP